MHKIKSVCLQNYLVSFLLVFIFSCREKSDINEKSGLPNILFVMSDDHAYQAISTYGSTIINTPNIDRIANEGIKFSQAFVTNSICAPSRAVILTGKYSHLNGVKGNGEVFDGSQQTLPKLMRSNGYRTAIIGKWHLKSHPVGFDYWNILPGQGDYYNPDFIKLGKDTTYTGYVTEIITRETLRWLEQRDKEKPFFLMMHHKAPHRNWMPALKNLDLFKDSTFVLPGNFFDSYEGREALKRQKLTVSEHMDVRLDFKVPCDSCDTTDVNFWAPEEYYRRMARLTGTEKNIWDAAYKSDIDRFYEGMNDNEITQWKYNRYMQDYLRCIVSVDESVGQVLDYLDESGLKENTVVIYTSDQGFYLGEHGLFDKRFMYEEAFRTPLMIRFPKNISPGVISDDFVLNLDIAPTILELVNAEIPSDMQGTSLRDLWSGSKPSGWRDAVYYHYYEKGFGATAHYGIRTSKYKLIRFYDPIDSWELYDLEYDLNEMNNIYQSADEELIAGLKTRMKELQEEFGDEIIR